MIFSFKQFCHKFGMVNNYVLFGVNIVCLKFDLCKNDICNYDNATHK